MQDGCVQQLCPKEEQMASEGQDTLGMKNNRFRILIKNIITIFKTIFTLSEKENYIKMKYQNRTTHRYAVDVERRTTSALKTLALRVIRRHLLILFQHSKLL